MTTREMRLAWRRSLLVLALMGAGCGSEDPAAAPESKPHAAAPTGAAAIDDERLVGADRDTENWLSHGRTYAEQRFSPLADVHAGNVDSLVQTWGFSTGLTRAHEATPIVVDGTMYLTGSWSVVYALDAVTGKQLWKWDPKVPREAAKKACCDVANRGVAVYRGRVYVGTFDGRLAALDAETGAVEWITLTVDPTQSYSITGAPRIVKGQVIIGNGGAEFGVRGYVSAYAAETGALLWRTYTVPGDPAKPFESKALESAAATWKGGEWWKIGGGGTVWDSMAFDPELDLLYVGTGNGSPWTRHIRSPGGGDNLYLSSILALDPDSGELVWHYQTTPGDNWDFTATQHMILADLRIDGRQRKVLMQAPKNGFFFVIDRATGEFISAENYVTVTWASHVDPETGRPVEVPGQDYKDGLALVRPTAFGGHNWHPMSYNPQTGLVYIPAQEIQGAYRLDDAFEFRPGEFNTGTDMNVFSTLVREIASGHLLAWDPVAQKEVWRHPYSSPWNGGTLTTAGNLVFQGTADGRFVAFRADDGKKLWEVGTGTGVIAAPVTFAVDGVQYVTIVAGWGGAFALAGGDAAAEADVETDGRVLTFALAPPFPSAKDVESLVTDPSALNESAKLYHRFCARCHGASGVGGGVLPDLRKSQPEIQAAFKDIVLKGIFTGKGMPSFAQWLDEEDVEQIQAYLRNQARSAM